MPCCCHWTYLSSSKIVSCWYLSRPGSQSHKSWAAKCPNQARFTPCPRKTSKTFFVRTSSNFHQLWEFLAQRWWNYVRCTQFSASPNLCQLSYCVKCRCSKLLHYAVIISIRLLRFASSIGIKYCTLLIADVDELKIRLIAEWAQFDQSIVDAAISHPECLCPYMQGTLWA